VHTATRKCEVIGDDMREEWDAAMDKVLEATDLMLRESGIDASDIEAASKFITFVLILREARTGKSMREEAWERTWRR